MAAEKNFENKIKRFLKERGAWYVKFFANAYTPSGIPDILGVYKGRFFAIEVKGGSSYGLTELQKRNLKRVNECGGIGLCVYPSGFDEMVEIFDDIENFSVDGENFTLRKLS